MSKKTLSRKATLVKGALLAFLCPRLAADSSIDLNAVLSGVDGKNWAKTKPGVAAAVEEAVKSKKIVLAQDASIDGLVDLLNGLDTHEAPAAVAAGADPMAAAADPELEDEAVDAAAGDPVAAILAALQGKMPDDELAALGEKLKACMGAPGADAASGAIVPAAKKPGEGEEDALPVDKKAMDAAIDKAVKAALGDHKVAMDSAVKKAKDEMRAIAEAEALVKPYVGNLGMSFDSADAVLKAALETLGVDVKDMHPTAYRSVLAAQTRTSANGEVRFAKDAAATTEGFDKRFPEAGRLKSA